MSRLQMKLKDKMTSLLIFEKSNCAINLAVNAAIASATEVIEEYNSENSKRAYKGDLTYWAAWYKANGLSPHEMIRKEHIILFIIQHAEEMPENIDEELVVHNFKAKLGTHKMSTIERRLASLSRYLQLNKLDNPCNDKDIVILMRKLTEKHGCSKAWGKAITLDILNDLIITCENDLYGIRDAALLLFGFSTGGRRRSEISSAVMENLIRSSDGNFIYNLGKSKTNQMGNEDPKPIAGRAAIALIRWLEASGIKSGPIFRGIRKGRMEVRASSMSDKQVCRIVKKRCLKAGYDPTQYTAHSLRSGFTTEGGKRGKPIGDIMAMTGHRCIQTVMRYYQTGAVLNNSAAYLAG